MTTNTKTMIPINSPIIGDEERAEVMKVLESGALTSASAEGGEYVRRFQKSVESFTNAKYAVAVNSGTSALYAALLALGVKAGDEVLVPSFTFLATANTVLLAGAKPVFVDIETNHYTMDPEDLEKKITRKSRAIIPVHLYGHPAKMDQITETAEKNSLSVIEDAAQSLGANYRGRATGTIGDIGCFSLYASKVITSGEGGFLTTNDDALAARLKMVRNHGMIHGYDSAVLGANLRLPEMEAAIASVQMAKLPSFLEARRRNAAALTGLLEGLERIILPSEGGECEANWSLYTVALPENRNKVKDYLSSNGIGAAVYYDPPVHRTPLYSETETGRVALPRTDWASRHVLSLPVHPRVSQDNIKTIASTVRDALST
ncbi:MAG: DegT/DnrJ/EryC1/StrS family aminotransferase [Thaumarchaeota archaeon]|nr:DegT/DnrJ/EryC1/StrS family aminotransferase [Nitrososphaerota archaeon]MCL5316688.1 DegT/DnrJ/EryC1/StrS family aminotransferase [Nitrososphaerota archaeon]